MIPAIKMPKARGGGLLPPSSRTSSKLWMDFDLATMWEDYARITQATHGSDVRSWRDKIAGIHYEINHATLCPALVADGSGLYFATGDRLATLASNLSFLEGNNDNVRFYLVLKPAAGTSYARPFTQGYLNSLGYRMYFLGDKFDFGVGDGPGGHYANKTSAASVVMNQMVLLEGLFDNANNVISPIINDGVKTDTAAYNYNIANRTGSAYSVMGGEFQQSGTTGALSFAYTGYYYSVLITVNEAAGDRAANLAYLKSKFTTLPLPE